MRCTKIKWGLLITNLVNRQKADVIRPKWSRLYWLKSERKQCRPWLDYMDVQADLGLHRLHRLQDPLCDGSSHIVKDVDIHLPLPWFTKWMTGSVDPANSTSTIILIRVYTSLVRRLILSGQNILVFILISKSFSQRQNKVTYDLYLINKVTWTYI